uniref:C2H2-type domain-containing protein n=1 Tax=Caenorhabditis tropicalis TaxID=1561998 RepID=A0A1I7V420_9PELO
MADNEAKARQKMAEGRKKLQGGGGFFSKVFGGGGGAGEAADLFIQYEEQSSSTEIECSYQGCEYVASNLLEYEQHYAQHSFQCSECGIGFDTAHRLEIHHDERHNPFFEIQIARQPLIAHFRCLHSTCELKFSNSRTRDEHSRIVHFIDGESSRRRKADATNDLCGAMNKMSVSEEESGWTGQNGHGLGIKEKRRQGGNLFKMAKNWKEAGEAFLEAAEFYSKQGDSKHDCATQYAEAANCFRKIQPERAVQCLEKTSEIYTDMGRFTMAAKNHVSIAELYESELPDKEQCVKHYQQAADYYKGEEQKSSASKCLVKVAMYSAELEKYSQAIAVFEEIAFYEADHSTLKYAAKGHFFQALLCHLCIDPINTQQALQKYENASPSFSDSRECKFIKELLAALEEQNEEAFTECTAGFDKISRLDNWSTSLLLKVKRTIEGGDDEDDLR